MRRGPPAQMSSHTATSATHNTGGKVSRACDACRVRKVRCSGDQPCAQCAHLNLACNFAPAPPKRKPGVRGRLVAQLRNKSSSAATNGSSNAQSSPPQSALHGGSVSGGEVSSAGSSPSGGSVPVTSIAGIVDALQTASPRSEQAFSIAGCGFQPDFFLGLLGDFEELVYPVNPVLTTAEVRASIHNMHNDYEDAALAHAYAALTVNLTKTAWTMNGCDVASQMTTLMQYSFWAHRKAEMAKESDGFSGGLQGEMPTTVKRIMTCIWLEICLMAFKRFDRSYAILQEAISLVQMLNVHRQRQGDSRLTDTELARQQRMYWEMYIHERFLFVMSGYPCTMKPLESLPVIDESSPSHVTLGFNRLISLFQNMDDAFLSHWAAQQRPDQYSPELTSQWIESKQAQLDQDETDALKDEEKMVAGGRGHLTELQHVDLFITRLWLRTLVWQLALSHGLLRSSPTQNTHEGLSLHFPAQRLSAQLRNLVSRLKNISIVSFHGSGILQKLFEITSTVADVLALPRATSQTQEEARSRLEDFLFLVRFIFSFERTQKHQRDYLRDKLEVLQKMYTVVDFRELSGASPAASSDTYDSLSRVA